MSMPNDANEESELVGEFSRMFRSVSMTGMQLSEMTQRSKQTRERSEQQVADARAKNEGQLTSAVSKQVYSKTFWESAGNRSIADTVSVAQELGKSGNAEANKAYMMAADTIRDRFGFNIETLQHADQSVHRQSLLNALDDHNAAGRQRDSLLDDEVQTRKAAELRAAAKAEAELAGVDPERYLGLLSTEQKEQLRSEIGVPDAPGRDARVASALESAAKLDRDTERATENKADDNLNGATETAKRETSEAVDSEASADAARVEREREEATNAQSQQAHASREEQRTDAVAEAGEAGVDRARSQREDAVSAAESAGLDAGHAESMNRHVNREVPMDEHAHEVRRISRETKPNNGKDYLDRSINAKTGPSKVKGQKQQAAPQRDLSR